MGRLVRVMKVLMMRTGVMLPAARVQMMQVRVILRLVAAAIRLAACRSTGTSAAAAASAATARHLAVRVAVVCAHSRV